MGQNMAFKPKPTQNPLEDADLMRAFADGQTVGDIRPNVRRELLYSVDDPSLSDADFREGVRRVLRNPWYE